MLPHGSSALVALGVVDALELLPLAHSSAPDELGVGAARGVVDLLPDAKASASDAQSSFAVDAPLRGVVVAGGAAGVSFDKPQSSTAVD